MPKPNDGESHDDFIERCIPVVIEDGTAKDGAQGKAVCESIWEDDKKQQKQESKMPKWMCSGVLKSRPKGKIDAEQGIIEGVSVVTAGEALGHGVHLDHEFLDTVNRQGSEKKNGLKARFGHPNMCSTALGTFLGRFKNFRKDGDQVLADLFLSNEAKNAPGGNLFDYVLGMAQNNPDMFGTSIVFTPGKTYVRDEKGDKVYDYGRYDRDDGFVVFDQYKDKPIYVECDELHACDAVDEPAANSGLFSQFATDTIAGQLTEFLDLNPQVWSYLNGNKAILDVLSKHGDKIAEFMEAYAKYKTPSVLATPATPDPVPDATPDPVVTEPTPTPTPDTPPALETSGEAQPTPPPTPDPVPVKVDPVDPPVVAGSAINSEEFAHAVEEFGGEITAQVYKGGKGSYEAVKDAYLMALRKENGELRTQLGVAPGSSSPARFAVASPDGTGKKSRMFGNV